MNEQDDLIENVFEDYDFNIDFDIEGVEGLEDLFIDAIDDDYLLTTRYLKPIKKAGQYKGALRYEYAKDLAKNIQLSDSDRYDILLAGSFVFGDFIEAWLTINDFGVKKMTVCTLSLNENNIDSLANLLNGGYVDELSVIISAYFYAHEKYNLVWYMLKELDIEDRFQLSICSNHCKIVTMEMHDGRKVVIHGSANLRSSACIEQIVIEENKQLFEFYQEGNNRIEEAYKIINKPIRNKTLWQKVVQKQTKRPKK